MGLRPKCENYREEYDDLRSTANAATTDQQIPLPYIPALLLYQHARLAVPKNFRRIPGRGARTLLNVESDARASLAPREMDAGGYG